MKKVLLIFGLILVLAAGGVFMYYNNLQKQKSEKFSTSFQGGRDLFYKGDTKSTVRFEDAMRNASTPSESALAKVNLAVSYLQEDPVKGVLLLKEMSLDESVPNFYRAGAVNYALNYYLGRKNVDFAKKHIFTGDKWQSFLSGEDRTAVELAIRKAFEWSADIFSTFVAEYRVAWWYAKQIKAGTVAPNKTMVKVYADIITGRIARGDAALASAIKVGKTPRNQIGLAYILKGLALEGLFKLGQSKESDIRSIYGQAISTLDIDPNDFQSRGLALYARYHLAAFLAGLAKPDANEIISILAPIYKFKTAPFFQFLSELKDSAVFGTDPVRKDIITLAKIDPKFKERLTALGWKESDFNKK